MESIKEKILAEYQKGNVVVSNFEGLQIAELKEIIKQPVDGLLYDINRNESVILTFIEDPKWVNDYASTQIIRELKTQLEEMKSKYEKCINTISKFDAGIIGMYDL